MFTCACFYMCTQTRNIHMHTTGLHMQAYVCACIFVPRNLNLDFLLSFLSYDMPLFCCFLMLLSPCSIDYLFVCP